MKSLEYNLGKLIDITTLFEGGPVFTDTNGDGYPDSVNFGMVVSPTLSDPFVWTGVLNLTARLSTEVTHLTLPCVHAGIAPSISERSLVILRPGKATAYCKEKLAWAELWRMDPGVVYLVGSSGKGMMTLLNALSMGISSGDFSLSLGWKSLKINNDPPCRAEFYDQKGQLLAGHDLGLEVIQSQNKRNPFHQKKSYQRPDLLSLAGENGLYETPNGEPRARKLITGFALDRVRLSPQLGLALAEVIARIVLEATEIKLPMVTIDRELPHEIIFQIHENKNEKNEIRLLDPKSRHPSIILAHGEPKTLARALRDWCRWAMIEGGPGCESTDRFRGQVKGFQELLIGRGFWGQWAQFLAEKRQTDIHEMRPAPAYAGRKLHKAFHSLSLPTPRILPGQRALRRKTVWKGELNAVLDFARRLPPGRGEIFGQIEVSKPLARRKILKSRLNTLLKKRGYTPHLDILNAYKPGQSWLLEYILPHLKRLGSISELEISYRPFPRKGKCLEMRSRWLQELFPAPELLVRQLGLDQKKLHLQVHRHIRSVYRTRAWDNGGQLVFNKGFSPRWSRFPYLNTDPKSGFVHPTTGRIKLWRPDKELLNEIVLTDRERFWQIFQNRWLPFLEDQMQKRLKRESFEGQTAFWKEILVEVCIEETDVRLGVGEERICPMEALHEDIYFVLLDAFSAFAKRNSLPPLLQLGRIVPKVFSKTGNGDPIAKLKAIPLNWAQAPNASRVAISAQVPPVKALSLQRGFWRMEFSGKLKGLESPVHEKLIKIAQAFGFKSDWHAPNFQLWVKVPRINTLSDKTNALALREKGPPLDRLLTAKEVDDWIQRLKRFPHLDVWRAAQSWQGRSVWAMEASLRGGGELVSTAKLRLLKPTLLFNARHHANEISSTNAALSMAWFLTHSKKGLELLKRVNVAWIPIENPDGVATFEELQSHCKDYKLHAARYNALGSEYYNDYFLKVPRFPEARAKPRLWKRWLPEIMVDHHGVPCHEWDQPFSGHAPFRFREFWIPRTFVYACIPFVEDMSHRKHQEAIKLGKHLGQAIGSEDEIVNLNRELAARYQRYARNPEPKTFPASTGEPLLVLPPLSRTQKINFAVRYPDITRSEIVIEVPDEVASGRLLELCARAHWVIEKRLIMLKHRPKRILIRKFDSEMGYSRLTWFSPGDSQKQNESMATT